MLKRIIVFIVISSILGFSLFYANQYYLTNVNKHISFSLESIYFFFIIASTIIYTAVEATSKYIPNQAGFAYLALMFIKIGVFLLIFKNVIFAENSLEMYERTAIILPFFLFLLLEGAMIGKLLNKK